MVLFNIETVKCKILEWQLEVHVNSCSWISECAWKFRKNILEMCNIQLIISNGIDKQSSKVVIK